MKPWSPPATAGAVGALAVLLQAGCYAIVATPDATEPGAGDAGATVAVSCNGAMCLPGEVCRDWGGDVGEACSARCNQAAGFRCPGSSLLCWSPGLSDEGWCFPGQPGNPTECVYRPGCGAGQACIRPLPDQGLVCAPLCNDDSECALNEACVGGCRRVCNPYEENTCAEGRVCRDGECFLESVARDCLLRDGSHGDPENCPAGEICVGAEDGGRWRCRSATDLEGLGCPPGQIEFSNGECYPRRE